MMYEVRSTKYERRGSPLCLPWVSKYERRGIPLCLPWGSTTGIMVCYAFMALFLSWGSLAVAQESKPKETIVINKVLGGIEGVNNDTFEGGDGTGIGRISLKVITLQLHKKSHGMTSAGKMEEKILPNDAKVVLGQVVYFTLYVDNLTDAELYKINMVDKIDENAFAYVPNSMEMAITDANKPAKEENFKANLTDDADQDIAYISDTPNSPKGGDLVVIGQTKDNSNSIASLASGKRLTIRFKVQIQ